MKQELTHEALEERVENLEKEVLVIKLALKKEKAKKVKLNELANKISAKAKPIETTSLISKMRKKIYE